MGIPKDPAAVHESNTTNYNPCLRFLAGWDASALFQHASRSTDRVEQKTLQEHTHLCLWRAMQITFYAMSTRVSCGLLLE